MHHHQSRHAQSPPSLSHSSCSYLKLQSPCILILHHVCIPVSSLRGHCSSTGIIPQVAVVLLWCVIVIRGRRTDNTLGKASEVNDLSLERIGICMVTMLALILQVSLLYPPFKCWLPAGRLRCNTNMSFLSQLVYTVKHSPGDREQSLDSE